MDWWKNSNHATIRNFISSRQMVKIFEVKNRKWKENPQFGLLTAMEKIFIFFFHYHLLSSDFEVQKKIEKLFFGQ